LYRELSLAFGWTPREIGALTLAEVAIYLETDNQRASRWLDADEARRRVGDRHKQCANWVRDVWEMMEHGLSTT
jgi:hypothetical protein